MSPKSLRILLVTHYYPSHLGGIEAVAGQLAKRIAPEVKSLTWAATNSSQLPTTVDNLELLPMAGTNIVEQKLQLPYPIWSPRSLIKLCRAVKGCDVVHIHDFLYLGNITAFVCAWIFRKKVVITQHIGFIPYNSPFLRLFLQAVNRSVGAALLKFSDRVVFISETVRLYFSQFVTLPKSRNIPNGVDLKTFSPLSQSERQGARGELAPNHNGLVCCFVGRFVEKKGIHILKHLAHNHPNIVFLCAGSGPLDPGQWNLPNVRVWHNLPPDKLRLLYAASDLLVLPSKGEGFPLVVQEAMACGTKPMVHSEVARAYPPAQNLMVEVQEDLQAPKEFWDRHLRAAAQRADDFNHERESISRFAQEHWSWDKCAREYLEMFREM